MDPVGPQNLIHVHPVLDLQVARAGTVTAEWGVFWRTSLDDGLYRLSGGVFRTGQRSRALRREHTRRYCVVDDHPAHHGVGERCATSYAHFFPGPFIKETPPGKEADYFTIWVAYEF